LGASLFLLGDTPLAYNFLDLTNATLRRFNDVTLTPSNFSTVKGFHATAKDSVNAALRDIYSKHVEWPFNYREETASLVPGQARYAPPSDLKMWDQESFRRRASVPLDCEAASLHVLTYDDYLQKHVDQEDSTSDHWQMPERVFFARDLKWGVQPVPDKAYQVTYEYYAQPLELEEWDVVPPIPEAFKWVIVEGATYWCHIHRDNMDAAQLCLKKFEQGINEMRRMLINRPEYMRASAWTR
jgi:hypothetical protein